MYFDRNEIIKWAAGLDERMFNRKFRLCREDFFYVLSKITCDLQKDARQAINSAGLVVSF